MKLTLTIIDNTFNWALILKTLIDQMHIKVNKPFIFYHLTKVLNALKTQLLKSLYSNDSIKTVF